MVSNLTGLVPQTAESLDRLSQAGGGVCLTQVPDTGALDWSFFGFALAPPGMDEMTLSFPHSSSAPGKRFDPYPSESKRERALGGDVLGTEGKGKLTGEKRRYRLYVRCKLPIETKK